jgi:hypothetical protein
MAIASLVLSRLWVARELAQLSVEGRRWITDRLDHRPLRR